MQNISRRSLRLAAAGLIAILLPCGALRADEPASTNTDGSSVPVSQKLVEKKQAQDAEHTAPVVTKPGEGQVGSSVPVLHPLTLTDPSAPVPPPAPQIVSPAMMCQGSAGSVTGGVTGSAKSTTVGLMAGCSGSIQLLGPDSSGFFRYEFNGGIAGTQPVGSAKAALYFRHIDGSPTLDHPAIPGHPDVIYAAEARANPVVAGFIPSLTFRLGSTDDTVGSHIAGGLGVMGVFQDRVNQLGGLEFLEGQGEATLALSRVLALDIKGTYGLYTAFNSQTPITVTDLNGKSQKVDPSSTGGTLLHAETDFRLHTGQNFWVALYANTDQLKYQVSLASPTDAEPNATIGSLSWGVGLRAGGAITK